MSEESGPPPKKVKFNIIIPRTTSLNEITLNLKDEEELTASTCKEEPQRPDSPEILSDNENLDNMEPEVILTTSEGDTREQNEKFCLISEVSFPLPKSSNKTLCIGVRPTEFFKPVVRVSNPQLTSTLIFDMETLKQFCAKLHENDVQSKEDLDRTEISFFLTNYHVTKEKNKDFQFKPRQRPKGWKSIWLSKDVVIDILKKEDILLNTLLGFGHNTKNNQEEYTKFISNVTSYVRDHGFNDFNKNVHNIIKDKHHCNPMLYDIASKLPCTLRSEVERGV